MHESAPLPSQHDQIPNPASEDWQSLAEPIEAAAAVANDIPASPPLEATQTAESPPTDPRELEDARTSVLLDAGLPMRSAYQILEVVRAQDATGGRLDPAGYDRHMRHQLAHVGVPESQWSLFGVSAATPDMAPKPVQRTPEQEVERADALTRLRDRAATDPGFRVSDEQTPYVSRADRSQQQVAEQRHAAEQSHQDMLTENGVPAPIARAVSQAASSTGRYGEFNVGALEEITRYLRINVPSSSVNDPGLLTGRNALNAILAHYNVDPKNW